MDIKGMAAKGLVKLEKHAPAILVGVGIVGTVAGTVLACKATLKVEKLKEERDQRLTDIQAAVDQKLEGYSDEDMASDTLKANLMYYSGVAKLYFPSMATLGLGLGSIIYGHRMLSLRNIGLAAAATASDKTLEAVREKVVEKYGETAADELFYNIKAEKLKKGTTQPEGKRYSKTEKTNDHPLGYKIFDEMSKFWSDDPNENLLFLTTTQNALNTKLRQKGRLFLNEVYEKLGLPLTKEGWVKGWLYNPDIPNQIRFTCLTEDERYGMFLDGNEASVLIDFKYRPTVIFNTLDEE